MPTVTVDLAVEVKLRVPHGNRRTILFRLFKRNTKEVQPVDTATAIKLEWSIDGVPQTPVNVTSGHPLANWLQGVVAVDLSADDVLANLGTYGMSLTGFFGPTSPRTWVTGTVEVYNRPGFTTPAP